MKGDAVVSASSQVSLAYVLETLSLPTITCHGKGQPMSNGTPGPVRPGRASHGPWRAACSTDVDREDSTSVTSETNLPGNVRRGLSVGNATTYGENSVLGLRQQEQLIKSIQEPDTSNYY